MEFIITSYCDLRGRIKGAAHTLISRIVVAFNMANIELSSASCSVEAVEARDG